MKYDVLNIDGDIIGDYSGQLWKVQPGKDPLFWVDQLRDWEYFRHFPRQVTGRFTFQSIAIGGKNGDTLYGAAITYDMDAAAVVVGTLVPREDQPGLSDQCKKCRVAGRFVRMSLVCPKCNGFIGGL